jgi:hypothetical protein
LLLEPTFNNGDPESEPWLNCGLETDRRETVTEKKHPFTFSFLMTLSVASLPVYLAASRR